MIVNGQTLLRMAPIKDMLDAKVRQHGVSHGLSEAGYDIRIKQEVSFIPGGIIYDDDNDTDTNIVNDQIGTGLFAIVSAIEEFQMPTQMVGIVHDKSTWARKGLAVQNTVIEPGWKGFLTLELTHHGTEPLHIPAGAGIAQVIFHMTTDAMAYSGKYQEQDDRPVDAIFGDEA